MFKNIQQNGRAYFGIHKLYLMEKYTGIKIPNKHFQWCESRRNL